MAEEQGGLEEAEGEVDAGVHAHQEDSDIESTSNNIPNEIMRYASLVPAWPAFSPCVRHLTSQPNPPNKP